MRRLRFLIVLAGVGALAACGSDSGVDLTLPPTESNVAGTFFLTFANGLSVPFNATQTATELWTLTQDRMVIAANNTWADTTNYQITSLSDGVQSTRQTASAGTYSITNGQINFVMTAGGAITFEGAVVTGSLIVNSAGKRYIYTK